MHWHLAIAGLEMIRSGMIANKACRMLFVTSIPGSYSDIEPIMAWRITESPKAGGFGSLSDCTDLFVAHSAVDISVSDVLLLACSRLFGVRSFAGSRLSPTSPHMSVWMILFYDLD